MAMCRLAPNGKFDPECTKSGMNCNDCDFLETFDENEHFEHHGDWELEEIVLRNLLTTYGMYDIIKHIEEESK